MKQTLKIILVSALATAALIKGAPALAEPAPMAVSIVATADLDLASEAGQRRLEQRLVTAAHAVCDTASQSDLKARNSEHECRAKVLSAARSKATAIAQRMRGEAMAIATR